MKVSDVMRRQHEDILRRKIRSLIDYAYLNGWTCDTVWLDVEDEVAVQVTGSRIDAHPDDDISALGFGFTVAFSVNPLTRRASALRLDGKPNAVLIITVDDGTDRYWFGPLSAHKRALADPVTWCGLESPAPEIASR